MNWLDSIPINLMNKDLDGLWTRQQAISDNIANVETPDYKTKNVSFEDQLKDELASSGADRNQTIQNLQGVEPTVTEQDTQTLANGNGVDLEQQNVELARTALNYYYSLQEMSDHFTRLKTAISGSGS